MENKPLGYLERIKSITDLAVKNNFPVKKMLEIYSKLNYQVYMNNDSISYDPVLEEKTFALTKFSLRHLN